jgi:hypothetical protein
MNTQLPIVIPFHWSPEKIEAVRNGTYPWRTVEHPSVTAWRNRHQRRLVLPLVAVERQETKAA